MGMNTGIPAKTVDGNYVGHQIIGRFQSGGDCKLSGKYRWRAIRILAGRLIYKDINNDGIINSLDERPIGYAWVPSHISVMD
jgi:hypothetical protein